MSMEYWLIFLSLALVATFTPGPAVFLVSTHSLAFGIKKTLLTILGNISGLLLMSLLSVLGLSAIILNSPRVFFVLKMVGAFYLVYLGIRIWRNGLHFPNSQNDHHAGPTGAGSAHRLYFQGILLSLSNPGAIAFTTALFPQFIEIEKALVPQFIILISSLMALSFSCLLGYAIIARKIIGRTTNRLLNRLLPIGFGTLFIGSGLALILRSQP